MAILLLGPEMGKLISWLIERRPIFLSLWETEELQKSPQEARVAVLSLRTERKMEARMVMLLLMMKWRKGRLLKSSREARAGLLFLVMGEGR